MYFKIILTDTFGLLAPPKGIIPQGFRERRSYSAEALPR